MAAPLTRPAGGWLPSRFGVGEEAAVPEAARAKLEAWLDQLAAWNRKMDLTAARDAAELADLMVADALVLARRIPDGARVVDVGTGAGAPGLALGILRADLPVTLAEPLLKRVSFLRTIIGALGLSNVTLRADRGEALPDDAWDVAVSRATLAPPEWLALGLRLAPRAWVLLAKDPPPPGAVEDDVEYTWPLGGAQRRAVLYRRA